MSKLWTSVEVKSSGKVKKFIFKNKTAVCESVLYAYPDYETRTVICCSVQSGCPVGCKFCGTGNTFVRNLTAEEIIEQVTTIIHNQSIKPNTRSSRFQIMFMSMGEPFLNYLNVSKAIEELHELYPNAELLVSTIGIIVKFQQFIELSKQIEKIGLQFSIHRSTDEERNDLIPFRSKMLLKEIRDFGISWNKATDRPVFLNYCVDGNNCTHEDFERLSTLFSPEVFNFTFSVICNSDETMKHAGYRNLDVIRQFENKFISDEFNTRIFDPSGQDDIGGGCGQLWFVQKWLKEKEENTNKN